MRLYRRIKIKENWLVPFLIDSFDIKTRLSPGFSWNLVLLEDFFSRFLGKKIKKRKEGLGLQISTNLGNEVSFLSSCFQTHLDHYFFDFG